MSESGDKFEKTKRMREALKKNVAAKTDKKAVAAAATPKKKKNNYRTAKARDLRTKSRGRMPVNTELWSAWDGNKWVGKLYVRTVPPGVGNSEDIVNDMEWEEAVVPKKVKEFNHEADGLFRLMEELDIMFWEWLAKEATADQKARLVFAPDPPVPAPWPNPSVPENTAPGSR